MKNSITLPIVLLTLIILACSCPDPDETTRRKTNPETSQTKTETNTKEETKEETIPPIQITAKELSKDYEDNELAANKKYKDKTLEVSGTIKSIAETMGNVTVSLKGHDMFRTVMCSFSRDQEEAVSELKKGQKVTFIGVGDGKTLNLYAGLKECKVKK